MLDILVPVLNRPHRVRPLLESIAASTRVDYQVTFICDPGDGAEIEAIRAADGVYTTFDGGYAAKINFGVQKTYRTFVFFGADDLHFHPGWFTLAAWELMTHGIEVVGVNDLCSERVRSGEHATHFLVTRRYCQEQTVDYGSGPLCEQYHHWFVDDEFVAVAKRRGVFAFAPEAIVEHLHYMNGKAPVDETYEIGRAQAKRDQRLFRRRRMRWDF